MSIAHWNNADISDKAHHWLLRRQLTRVRKKIFTILRQLNPTPRYFVHFVTGAAYETVPTFQCIAKCTDYADEHRAWSAWLGSGRAAWHDTGAGGCARARD